MKTHAPKHYVLLCIKYEELKNWLSEMIDYCCGSLNQSVLFEDEVESIIMFLPIKTKVLFLFLPIVSFS